MESMQIYYDTIYPMRSLDAAAWAAAAVIATKQLWVALSKGYSSIFPQS